MNPILTSKTFYAAVGVIGVAFSGYLQKEYNAHTAAVIALVGLMGIFGRLAVVEVLVHLKDLKDHPGLAALAARIDVDAVSAKIAADSTVAIQEHTGVAVSLELQEKMRKAAADALAPPPATAATPKDGAP